MSADARRELIELKATEVFAQRGYRGASIEEIARQSGITPPVVYDHFASKRELYERLLERYYSELREIWFRHAASGLPLIEWLPPAVDDWFAYVHDNRFAGRLLFRDTTGDPEIAAAHQRTIVSSRDALLRLMEREVAGTPDQLEMMWETMRAVLQGLTLWWYGRPDIPRKQVVATAMNSLWIGFERFLNGDRWPLG